MTFGEFIRQSRLTLGYSLRGMANKLDIEPMYLSRVERDITTPRDDLMVSLAGILNINIDILMGIAGKITPDILDIILQNPGEISRLLRAISKFDTAKVVKLAKLIEDKN
jgi:HTH-type transcriptional regulator, competence development regulator